MRSTNHTITRFPDKMSALNKDEDEEEYIYSDCDSMVIGDDHNYDAENLFFDGEESLKDDPDLAIKLFTDVIKTEQDHQDYKWTSKALQHLMKLYLQKQCYSEMVMAFNTLISSFQSISYENSCFIQSFLDGLELSFECLPSMCEATMVALRRMGQLQASNRLWIFIKLKLVEVCLAEKKYFEVVVGLSELKAQSSKVSCVDRIRNLMEIYCLEVQYCRLINDTQRLKSVVEQAREMKSAIVRTKVMAVIWEESGILHMNEGSFAEAYNEFYRAFEYYNQSNHPQARVVLKRLVIAGLSKDLSVLLRSEARHLVTPDISALSGLGAALKSQVYAMSATGKFDLVKKRLLLWATSHAQGSLVPKVFWNKWMGFNFVHDWFSTKDYGRLSVALGWSDSILIQLKFVHRIVDTHCMLEERMLTTFLWNQENQRTLGIDRSRMDRLLRQFSGFYECVPRFHFNLNQLNATMEMSTSMNNADGYVGEFLSKLDSCTTRNSISSLFMLSKYILGPVMKDWLKPVDIKVLMKALGKPENHRFAMIWPNPGKFQDFLLSDKSVIDVSGLVLGMYRNKIILTDALVKTKLKISSPREYITDLYLSSTDGFATAMRQFYRVSFGSSYPQVFLDTIVSSVSCIRHLELSKFDNVGEMRDVLPHLESLKIDEISDEFLISIAVYARVLKKLTIKRTVSSKALGIFGMHGPLLNRFSGRFCNSSLKFLLVKNQEQLETLRLSESPSLSSTSFCTNLDPILPLCYNLTSLSLWKCSIGEEGIVNALRNQPIQSLTICHSKFIIGNSFWSAVMSCDLKHFEIRKSLVRVHSFALVGEIRCSHLTSLVLSECGLTNNLLVSVLNIQETPQITLLDISGNDIHDIDWTSLAPILTSLTHLNLSSVHTDQALFHQWFFDESLFDQSPTYQSVLNQSLTQCATHCLSLKHLNLSGNALTASNLEVIFQRMYLKSCILVDATFPSSVCSELIAESAPQLEELKVSLGTTTSENRYNPDTVDQLKRRCPLLNIIVATRENFGSMYYTR